LSAGRVLVTGGSRGIGRAVAERLAAGGRRVIITGSSEATVEAALAALGDDHEGHAFDVADESAWERLAPGLAKDGLEGVVTAAGVLGPIGPLGEWPVEEFRRTLEVNVIGTLLALASTAPLLRESQGAAVTFSGGGATGPLPRFDAYAASKAAVVRMSENLAAAGDVRVNCVAPGFIATDIHEATLAAGPEAVGPEYFERTRRDLESGGADLDAVCDLVEFLLAPESRPISGKLIAAQWDPWREPEFQARLAGETDLATLRRIDDHAFGPAR
jgi:NAD(P)-dependent dehydrogenase (short-subunit alcohol dehydrogenase family)